MTIIIWQQQQPRLSTCEKGDERANVVIVLRGDQHTIRNGNPIVDAAVPVAAEPVDVRGLGVLGLAFVGGVECVGCVD